MRRQRGTCAMPAKEGARARRGLLLSQVLQTERFLSPFLSLSFNHCMLRFSPCPVTDSRSENSQQLPQA